MQYLIQSVLFFMVLSAVAQNVTRSEYPTIAIHQIATCTSDTFRVSGRVIAAYNCPPCPPGAVCKPCMGDHVTIEDPGAPATRTLVFVRKPDEFKMGSQYLFTLTLQNKSHPEFGNNGVAFDLLHK